MSASTSPSTARSSRRGHRLKSFKKKDDDDTTPPDDPGNPTVDFHGEKRSNETHESTTDPDAKLARKGKGKEAKLSYSAHALMENRNGLLVDFQIDVADGCAERRMRARDARQQLARPAAHHPRRRQGLRHERLRRGLPGAQRHAARRAEHHQAAWLEIDERTTGHRRLRDQPAHPQTRRGGLRLDEDRRQLPQDSLHRLRQPTRSPPTSSPRRTTCCGWRSCLKPHDSSPLSHLRRPPSSTSGGRRRGPTTHDPFYFSSLLGGERQTSVRYHLGRHHHIPFKPPFSAATVGVVAVTWGPATSLLVWAVPPGDWRSLLLHVPLPIAAYIVGRFTFSARSMWAATILLGLAFAVNLIAMAPTPLWARHSVLSLAATIVLNVLIGVAYAVLLVGPLWTCIKSGSHEDVDRALVYSAPWIALPVAFYSASSVVFSLSVDLLLLPVALAFVAVVRIRARRRWLAEVSAGKHPRWRLLERQSTPIEALPAIVRGSGDTRECVLAFVHEADTPFRDGQQLEAVARMASSTTPLSLNHRPSGR